MGTTARKKLFSMVFDSFPSWMAEKVSWISHTPGLVPISSASSATMAIHCWDTWKASTPTLPSLSCPTLIVIKGVSSRPSAASSCSSAAMMISAEVKTMSSSLGACPNIHPTFCKPNNLAISSTLSSSGSSSCSKPSAASESGSCGGSYMASTTVFFFVPSSSSDAASYLPYKKANRLRANWNRCRYDWKFWMLGESRET
mmetsp:Transcript_6235/g.14699  ORF Transcript_6235/g.14699 Transcript_6235/m.14699 type:complete len:200 (-) Transcript_6235:669-1268(-)